MDITARLGLLLLRASSRPQMCTACRRQMALPVQIRNKSRARPSPIVKRIEKNKLDAKREKLVTVLQIQRAAIQNMHDPIWIQDFDAWYRKFNEHIGIRHTSRSVRELMMGVLMTRDTVGVTARDGLSPEQVKRFRTLCSDLRIYPATVPLIARMIARKPGDVTMRWMAKTLLEHASGIGDRGATLYLVDNAINRKQLDHASVKNTLKTLKRMAEKGTDFRAMAMHAMVLDEMDQANLAAEMFEKAARRAEAWLDGDVGEAEFYSDRGEDVERGYKQALEFQKDSFQRGDSVLDDSMDLDAGKVLREWANFQLVHGIGGTSGFKETIEKAAFRCNDPQAYFYLRQLLPRGQKYSMSWYEYTLKAATAGHPEATCDMATLLGLPAVELENQVTDPDVLAELKRLGKTAPLYGVGEPRSKEDVLTSDERNRLSWALEWLTTGTYRNHAKSIIESAKIYWRFGKSGKAVTALMTMGELVKDSEFSQGHEAEANTLLNEWCEADEEAEKTSAHWEKMREHAQA